MVCFLCRDSFNEYYKICECLDSTLCYECYKLTNQNNIKRCSICRKTLKYNKTQVDFKFIKILFLNILNYTCLLVLELNIPYYSLVYLNNKILNFCYIVYAILLLNSLNYYFILQLNEAREIDRMIYIYNSIKVLYLIFYCIIFYFLVDKDKIIELYLLFILFVLYVIPLTFSVSFLTINNKYKYIKELYKEHTIKLIKYRIF